MVVITDLTEVLSVSASSVAALSLQARSSGSFDIAAPAKSGAPRVKSRSGRRASRRVRCAVAFGPWVAAGVAGARALAEVGFWARELAPRCVDGRTLVVDVFAWKVVDQNPCEKQAKKPRLQVLQVLD